jgi:hypothetical protein
MARVQHAFSGVIHVDNNGIRSACVLGIISCNSYLCVCAHDFSVGALDGCVRSENPNEIKSQNARTPTLCPPVPCPALSEP